MDGGDGLDEKKVRRGQPSNKGEKKVELVRQCEIMHQGGNGNVRVLGRFLGLCLGPGAGSGSRERDCQKRVGGQMGIVRSRSAGRHSTI